MLQLWPVLVCLLVVSARGSQVLIHKCCPQEKQLSFTDEGVRCHDLLDTKSEFWWWLPRDDKSLEVLGSLRTEDVGYKQPDCERAAMDVLRYDAFNESDFSFHARDGQIRLEVLKGDSFHDDKAMRGDSFPADSFCVDLLDEGQHVILLCPCRDTVCVRGCCRNYWVYDHSVGGCVEVPMDDMVNGTPYTPWTPRVNNRTDYYKLTNRIPACRLVTHEFQASSNGSLSLLLDDGSLKTLDGSDEHIPRDKFCGTYNIQNREQILFCMQTNVEWFWKRIIYGIMFLIGAFCLLLTIIVTLILPEMRRNIHGKMAVAHNAMLFLGHLVTGISQLRGDVSSQVSCEVMSLIIQFSILAAFFWLNVMCIDISWTFSGLRPIRGTAMQRDRKKFIYYSLYAWGSTALISTATVIVEYSPSVTSFKPNFGVAMCFFNDRGAELLFFYGPMALLLGANLALFGYTAYKIIAVKRETSILSTGDSSTTTTNHNKQTLTLYVKLFCLMGVTWVTEVISWAVGGDSFVWYFTDLINLLRAVFIFVIFCCKRKVYLMLRDRLHQGLGRPPLERYVSRNARSSSSGGTRTTGATSMTPNSRRKFSTQNEEIEMSKIPRKSKESIHDRR